MERIHIDGWTIDIDKNKTKRFYDSLKVEENCNCNYCKNYIVNCNDFSENILGFFNMLGIDPKKEGEFMEFESDSNKHLYMGFYHLVGRIINKPNRNLDKWNDVNTITIDNINFTFSEELNLVPKNFPKPIIQLNFEVILPWLMEEKSEYN